MLSKKQIAQLAQLIIDSGAITIKEEPFVYSSGNRGPGYIMIKGLVGQPTIMRKLSAVLAEKIHHTVKTRLDFINGNVTGGMLYGWEIRNVLSEVEDRELPYVYLRGTRKEGGLNELITGDQNNPLIKEGMEVLIVEELVNYAETTINAVKTFRNCNYVVNYAACILSYDHELSRKRIKEHNFELISLITLKELLDVAEEYNLMNVNLVKSYKEFLNDSVEWQLSRNLVVPEDTANEAISRGYIMVKLSNLEALHYGAPKSKVDSGITYWRKILEPKKVYIPKFFVALDYTSLDELVDVAKQLSGVNYDFGFKINLDIIVLHGIGIIDRLSEFKKPLFIDVKIANGLRTMETIIHECVKRNVAVVNVYASVGVQYLKQLAKITRGTNTKLFALTILTHYDDTYTNELYNEDMDYIIGKLASWAEEAGVDGIIVPPTYLDEVRDLTLLKMCPGIVLTEYHPEEKTNNQLQISTPGNAFKNGANSIIVGSAITKSEDKLEAMKKLIDEL